MSKVNRFRGVENQMNVSVGSEVKVVVGARSLVARVSGVVESVAAGVFAVQVTVVRDTAAVVKSVFGVDAVVDVVVGGVCVPARVVGVVDVVVALVPQVPVGVVMNSVVGPVTVVVGVDDAVEQGVNVPVVNGVGAVVGGGVVVGTGGVATEVVGSNGRGVHAAGGGQWSNVRGGLA